MRFMLLKNGILFAACTFLYLAARTCAGETDALEFTVSGDAAYEFFVGMSPPLHRGDWVAFERDGGKIVATIMEAEGEGEERKIVIAVQEHDAKGKESEGGTQEVLLSEVTRKRADRHDHFVVAPRQVKVKGTTRLAASVKGFRDGVLDNEFTISPEVPLGEVIRHYNGPEVPLADFGWGEALFRPEDMHLSFERMAEKIGAALPEPVEGEWTEYAVPTGMATGEFEKFHFTVGVSGIDGNLTTSMYGVDKEGNSYRMDRLATAGIGTHFGKELLTPVDFFTVSPESITLKGVKTPALAMNAFRDGVLVGRFHFSAALPFPWLAKATIFRTPEIVTMEVTDWGREEMGEYTRRERETTVDEAIGQVVDASLAKAAVGDWALYELLNGKKIRHELVEINNEGDWPYYVNLIQELDAAGNVLNSEKKRNVRDEIVNGYILRGDVRSDRYEILREEREVKGAKMPVLSVTGYEEDKPRYRIELSEDVPATELIGLVIFDLSPEPFMRLVDYGRP